jgi:hypothetical protein
MILSQKGLGHFCVNMYIEVAQVQFLWIFNLIYCLGGVNLCYTCFATLTVKIKKCVFTMAKSNSNFQINMLQQSYTLGSRYPYYWYRGRLTYPCSKAVWILSQVRGTPVTLLVRIVLSHYRYRGHFSRYLHSAPIRQNSTRSWMISQARRRRSFRKSSKSRGERKSFSWA